MQLTQISRSPRPRKTSGAWIVVLLAVVTTCALEWHILHGAAYGLPFADGFSQGRGAGWTAFGGTWQILDGAMQNISDERGAKLVTGSRFWTDYAVETDLRLEGDSGDAGILLRVQDADEGVDAFRGFYAGLRLRDNSLVGGDADYGWTELAPQVLAEKLSPFQWYHLRAAVKGCHLSVEATTIEHVHLASLEADVPSCSEKGQIGLRSYASGGSWRDIRVRALHASSPEHSR